MDRDVLSTFATGTDQFLHPRLLNIYDPYRIAQGSGGSGNLPTRAGSAGSRWSGKTEVCNTSRRYWMQAQGAPAGPKGCLVNFFGH